MEGKPHVKPADHDVMGELRALKETVKHNGHCLFKWARQLRALLQLLEQKQVLTKNELMEAVYRHLKDSGALERTDDDPEKP